MKNVYKEKVLLLPRMLECPSAHFNFLNRVIKISLNSKINIKKIVTFCRRSNDIRKEIDAILSAY